MKWIFQAIAEVLATVIAYITNPFIVLFADEYGILPNWAKWWGTFDNCLDVEWMISEDIVPKFAQYDFNKHYVYHLEEKGDNFVKAGYVDIIDGNFTVKEKIQRYICRVCWLYRNTHYGFSYYVNGRTINKNDIVVVRDIKEEHNEQFIGYIPDGLWNTTWCIYYEKPYFKKMVLRIYLGWKLKARTDGVHMIALFISPFRILKD